MCNCGKRAAAERSVPRQAGATPIVGRGIRSAPAPVIYDPVLWGPHMWTALHTLSVFVPFVNARVEWQELLTHLAASLPCPECAGHYGTWLASHPLVQTRRRTGGLILMMRRAATVQADVDIAAWVLDLHNAVNGRKRIGAWTLDSMRATYGGDVGTQRIAVQTAINAVRGMIGARAIQGIEQLMARM